MITLHLDVIVVVERALKTIKKQFLKANNFSNVAEQLLHVVVGQKRLFHQRFHVPRRQTVQIL